ncbi:MAG: hypothetical protein ACRDGA_07300 [Bacteroidota bacterium]
MKRRKPRAYLSGGMEYAKKEGADWRRELHSWLEEHLDHTVFNPSEESVKFLSRHLPRGNFRKLKTIDLPQFTSLVRKIVDLDSREIARRSDYLVCYWDRSAQQGAGTKGELTIAKFFGKPVYMVTRINHANIPGWILGCTTEIFGSFSLLKLFLKGLYRNPKQR